MDLSMYVYYTEAERKLIHRELYGTEIKPRRSLLKWVLALLGF